MTYAIAVNYLEHSGGTKFYETVLITEEGGPGLLIKRYGAIDKKMGGGQTIIERGDPDVVKVAQNSILDEKRKLRPGKGSYTNAALLSFGLHRLSGRNVDSGALAKGVINHFGVKDRSAVLSYFGISGTAADDVVNEAPPPEPEAPVIRGESWGSW